MKTAFVKVYRMDKTAHLQYIAACEQVRLSYRDTTQSHEKQAVQKRKERRNKKYPQDKQPLQGPIDMSTNFASTTTSRTSKRKQPPACCSEWASTQTKKQWNTSQSQPDLPLMFQKCQVLYEDDVWYGGTVTGIEFCDEKKKWMYKISFSDSETTLAARDDPEVRFPF